MGGWFPTFGDSSIRSFVVTCQTIRHTESLSSIMPTYTYETIPQSPDEKPERFEVKQSILAAPLAKHPETGAPVRRVITGGLGFLGTSAGGGHRHGPSCSSGFG